MSVSGVQPLPPGVVAVVRLPIETETLTPVVMALQAAYPRLLMSPGPDDGHVLLVERATR